MKKKSKLEDLHFLISTVIQIMQHWCDIDIKTDIKTYRIEYRAQKETLTYTIKLFLRRVPRPFNGEETVVSTNGTRKIGCPHAEE